MWKISGIDPYNRTEEKNRKAAKRFKYADVVLLSNILNVLITEEARTKLLQSAWKELSKTGTLYVTVYEGDKSGYGRMTKKDCWQANKKIDYYARLLKNLFGNIKRKGKLLVVRKKD